MPWRGWLTLPKAWAGEITCIAAGTGLLYLAVVMDLNCCASVANGSIVVVPSTSDHVKINVICGIDQAVCLVDAS